MSLAAENTLDGFNRAFNELNTLYHEAALRLEVNDSELDILYMLHSAGGGCPLPRLCGFAAGGRQTINSALRKMEKAGLVSLRPADGRSKVVCLTPAGRETVDRKIRPLKSLEARVFEEWTEQEQAEYLRLLQKYLEAFRKGLPALKQEDAP